MQVQDLPLAGKEKNMLRTLVLVGLMGFVSAETSTETRSDAPQLSPDAETANLFFRRLQQLCHRAFEGQVVKSNPGDTLWQASRILIHGQHCSEHEIRLALHVGKDRSRTWVIRHLGQQLSLKHEHLQQGQPEAISAYGGLSASQSTATAQAFPADAESIALFEAHNMSAASANIWWLLFLDNGQFVYRLTRPHREFQINFDLSQPVPLPAAS